MKKKLDTAADMALDDAAEAAKLTLADRLVKEAATCDLKTLAQTLECVFRPDPGTRSDVTRAPIPI